TFADPALLAIATVALRPLMRVGAKITDAVHEAPGFNECPEQPSADSEKSSGFAPAMLSDEMTSGVLPVLVIVTSFAELLLSSCTVPNASDVGVRLSPGVNTNPFPLRATSGGTPCELPGTSSFPYCIPAPVGTYRTETLQDWPGARMGGQVLAG